VPVGSDRMTDRPATTMDNSFSDVERDSMASEISDNCESFLENYARGQVQCPGEDPPAEAFAEINADHLLSGKWPAPEPPTEEQRVRELYSPNHSLYFRFITVAVNCAGTSLTC
jgi:hypothetical protein